ncbi:MAG: sigma-70 family RNA polymerase sigma factor [FCB group bacterium]|jgi:RNA polymerase sigma-70 factor (ECF subfamily)|nr:sigma-70 family RNA polymerase sigma factor [FCB group bacterium]
MTDAEAIQAVIRGDRQRYAELVERHQAMVYGIAWSRLGDRDLCDEAAQETFIKAYRYLTALRDPSRFPGWLARIARNVSTSLLRRRVAEREGRKRWELARPEAEATQPEGEAPVGETLRQVLAEMPTQHRECLVLFYLEDKSIEDSARALGISEAAMRTRLHRARQALRGRLEEAMETSLSELRPPKGFTAGVMPLLPALPLAATFAEYSIATKIFGPLAKSAAGMSLFLWMTLGNVLFVSAVFAWMGRLEAANLRPGPGKGFRTQLIRAGVVNLIAGTAIAMVSAFAIMAFGGGPQRLFQILSVLCLWQTYKAARILRVNRVPYTIGVFVSALTFLLVMGSIGFFNAPYLIFLFTLFPLNLVLHQTNKSRPCRHDYNLFLRLTQGLLGESTETAQGPTRSSRKGLRSFARFLGHRFLIVDYSFGADGIVLHLPPVKVGLGYYFGLSGSNSTVSIGFDGECRARIGRRDLRHVRAFAEDAPNDQKELEDRVASVVETAHSLFASGQSQQVEALLQATADEEVLLKPLAESREHKMRGRIVLASSALILPIGILAMLEGTGAMSFGSKEVSRDMASAAVGEWSREFEPTKPSNFPAFLQLEALPPLSFLKPGGDTNSFRDAVCRHLMGCENCESDRINRAFQSPRALYNVIEAGILSKEELAGLGFTPERVREVLSPGIVEVFNRNSRIVVSGGTGTYDSLDVDAIAHRLALLKEYGCLDLVDGNALAKEIASKQIREGWKTPEGFAPVNVDAARGLFHFGWCDFRGTRGALWTLQVLGRLDLIDKEACIEGILRQYRGRGIFRSYNRYDLIGVHGKYDDAFFALESLRILNALDRIEDLDRWKFKPTLSMREQNGKKEYDVVTSMTLKSWAYRLRLEQIRGY